MKPDTNILTLNKLKGVRYLVSITIPTVYTHQFSYYEVCGKLINHLDYIRTNQNDNSCNMTELANWLYEQIEEEETYLKNFYTEFKNTINKFLTDSENKWNDFITSQLTTYNNYKTDLLNRMNTFENDLNTTINNFKTELTNKHTSYTTYLNNRHTTHTNNMQNKVNEYKNLISTNKTSLGNELKSLLDEIVKEYENLIKTINEDKKAMSEFIKMYEEMFIQQVNQLSNSYQNIQDRVIANNDILQMTINYLEQVPLSLRNVGTPIYTMINYTGRSTPTNPQANDIWLKEENMGDTARPTYINRLYRYNGTEWELITDNGLYLTSDYHIYYADNVTLPLLQEKQETPTGEGLNTSAWYVPIGYERGNSPKIITMQQYSTATDNVIGLDYDYHSYSTCIANRGFGAYNLTYKNINNDFQRILTLKDNSMCLQCAKGIYKGEPDLFPNPYENTCNPIEDTPILSDSDYQLVTGIFMIDYPILYRVSINQYYAYYPNTEYANNLIPLGEAQPRFSIGTKIYCFKENTVVTPLAPAMNNSYYIDVTNPNTRQGLSTQTNAMCEEFNSLQLSDNEKYIFSTNKVWLTSEFLAVLEDLSLPKLKPILVLPTPCEHAHIFEDTLFTTHTNYAIDLLKPLGDKFKPVDVDIKANGIWVEDQSTWVNGFIFAGIFWQFSLVNETDKTVPHITRFGLQGVRVGAKEISYVPISTPTN